ncbi:MAG TPA: mycothiol synthase [Jiangellaceae bacterium]|nr:mycothiol synthase [Jiangellaceae bacterium]
MIAAARRLDDDTADAVAALIAAATESDRVAPVSEQGLLRLRADGDGRSRHLVARDGRKLTGYAQLDVDGSAAELVVHPVHRRRGVGRSMVDRLIGEAHGTELRVWAHGDLPAAAALATATGFTRARSLWKMARPLSGPLPQPQVPDGVVVDTFVPGADDAAWLTLNARAFAAHPEQGRWTASDLRQRSRQRWFDPRGFFVARRGPRMIGFHWTKIDDDTTGEVYVVGADPDEQGIGLGRALTLIGLHHLRTAGLEQVVLYVDEDNRAAVHLYTTIGFERAAVDVMYRRSLS